MRRLLLALTLALAATPASAQVEGVDHVASDGVELAANVRAVGSGQGAAVMGERLLVWGPSQLSLLDISDPGAPALLGVATLTAANESEDVVTNGRIAAMSMPACEDAPGGCVQIFDVSDSGPAKLSTIPIPGQVGTCVMDCRYLWVTGPNQIVDLADPANPKVVGGFLDDVDEDSIEFGCFQGREVKPGIVLLACDPVLLLSTLPEHGGSPAKPKLIATGKPPAFDFFLLGAPHSAHWPRMGADRFMLTSTETALHAECSENIGAFVTWDARPVASFAPGSRFTVVDSWRPANGTYTDGRSPYNAVGCSPHFLDEHPAFRDGGLVAVAALENGVRLLEVTSEGKIEERAWFLGAGATAAVPAWHPDGKHLYVADYARGLDVIRYSGATYATPAPPQAGDPPSGGPPVAPQRRLRVAGRQVDRRRGRATLIVEIPSAGRLEAAPKAGRQRLRRLTAEASRAGLVRLTIVPTGRAKRTLAKRRRLAVSVHLTFTDANGAARFARTRITLRRAR